MKRHIYLNMKSVEEAREIFLTRFDLDTYLPPEEIPTAAALGRVTTAPVFAGCPRPTITAPPWTGSAVSAEVTLEPARINPMLLELRPQAFPAAPATLFLVLQIQ